MSAEVMREAARNLREWWPDCDCHAPERAVADWLEFSAFTFESRQEAVRQGVGSIISGPDPYAVAVARAYLDLAPR